MKEELFTDIIKRFLEGNATPNEKEMLSNWLRQEPANQEVFYLQLLKRENDCPQHLPQMESKIRAFEQFLENATPMVERRPASGNSSPFTLPKIWYWAASVMLILSASFYFFNEAWSYRTYAAEKGIIRSVTLQDGSKVILNANSTIKVLRNFLGHERREVWIKGEAFFEVAKEANKKPFIVHAKNVDVEVLGTRFNVNDRREKTEVTLEEGKVKLVSKDQKPLVMVPGEMVAVSAEHKFIRRPAEQTNYEAWRKYMLVFENTPLLEVAQAIHDYYGVEVRVSDPALAARRFTGTLPNNDLDVVLMSLATAYQIEIEHQSDVIILR